MKINRWFGIMLGLLGGLFLFNASIIQGIDVKIIGIIFAIAGWNIYKNE